MFSYYLLIFGVNKSCNILIAPWVNGIIVNSHVCFVVLELVSYNFLDLFL